jgi:hypothetical protein
LVTPRSARVGAVETGSESARIGENAKGEETRNCFLACRAPHQGFAGNTNHCWGCVRLGNACCLAISRKISKDHANLQDSRRGAQERKTRRLRAWAQWAALLLSGLLLSVAAALLAHAGVTKH